MSFRDKNCVTETLEEINIVKSKLSSEKEFDQIHIMNWEVEDSIPTSDIIWSELNKGRR